MEHRASEVSQAQLDHLRAALYVCQSISMRGPARSKLFHDAFEADNEIPFLMAALECEV